MATSNEGKERTPDAAAQADLLAAFDTGRVEDVALAAPRIDTHLSHVFLTKTRAYKMKRAVKLPFVDFSTLEKRHQGCLAELDVNRRMAGAMYVGVKSVVALEGGRYRIGGKGDPLDWVIEMKRFDQSMQFDELAKAGRLTPALLEKTADAIAEAHGALEPVLTTGHAADYRAIVRELRETETDGADRLGLHVGDPSLYDALDAALAHADPLIERRRREGKVRRGHGDLHLRNMCLFEGEPTLFDALEFDERLATNDVLYDLAFLLMDLRRIGMKEGANLVMNRYWDAAREEEAALELLPFFMALRATVRMAVAVEAEHFEEADEYRRLAFDLLHHTHPRAVAIGGLSGAGKSAVAKKLAGTMTGPAGARWLRTDVLRKRARDKAPEEKMEKDAYAPEARAKVYDDLFAHAAAAFDAGASVIIDATFQEKQMREAAASLAHTPVAGFWLDAPLAVRLERIGGREGDASDAGAEVAKAQREPESLGQGWTRIDATGTVEEVAARVRAALAD
ncbi:AAA family ATPase [Hyphococcus luteus]|uniref:Aminoglycoside phosphotransferase n=1 Tax=Hyphococcus luteus TaxID=2058213 RepID=A0A2S7K4U1_9PROT|nr:AAA family ATPase [Marinicaulis flavus]PQA87527.1 aminoglycoside phosphotransferase [Marinicaulis flavus]